MIYKHLSKIKTMKKLILLLSLFFLVNIFVYSQDTNEASHLLVFNIPDISLIDIHSTTLSNDVEIDLTTGVQEAGLDLDFTNSNYSNLWINYTTVNQSGKTKRITAKVKAGNLPKGIIVKVSLNSITSHGAGEKGVPQGTIELTQQGPGEIVVDNIGSCYTGDGPEKGINLIYEIETDDVEFDKINSGVEQVEIIYTILEN